MGFYVTRNNIVITRGDSAVITLSISNPDSGEPYIPTGDDRLTMTVKKSIDDAEAIIIKTLGNGIEVTEDGCILHIDPADTSGMQYGDYVYDVELIMGNGYTDTIIPPSQFRITGEVTTHD